MNKIALVSGGFDPLNAAHINLICEAATYGHVVVLLHSDNWCRRNLHSTVTPWGERARLLHEITKVIEVIEIDDSAGDAGRGVEEARKKWPGAKITYLSSAVNETNTQMQQHCQQLRVDFVVAHSLEKARHFRSHAPIVQQLATTHANTPVNIVCLKWGTKYGADYVNKLFYAIKRNTTRPFAFHCFTDDATGINSSVTIHELTYKNLDTWWNKLYLFSDEIAIPLGEKIFYVDLDTLITANIDALLDVNPKKLVVLQDFYAGIAKTANSIGSGLMAWTHGTLSYVWRNFISDPESAVKLMHPHGDQYWIQHQVSDVVFWQTLYPDQVVSFKVHCRSGLPATAAIVCYHGAPSIPESITNRTKSWKWTLEPAPWVANYWKDAPTLSIRFAMINAVDIFGSVGRCGGGYNTLWEDWSPVGRARRNAIIREFEAGINKICGHYTKLEASIRAEGIRNPVIVTCGMPKKRSAKHLPPEIREKHPSEILVLESTAGGSRLWIAQQLGLKIPCIVNDWQGRFSDCPEIITADDARRYYQDWPALIKIDPLMGLVEGFDSKKVGHHLGAEWSEDKILEPRALLWVKTLNKYGYLADPVPPVVREILLRNNYVQTRGRC